MVQQTLQQYTKFDSNLMQDQQTILRLIDKIDTALPEIKLRSITSLHTKITIGLIEVHQLQKFKKLPGVLLTWINENTIRSENLFKVLTILSYFTKTQEGLVLLEQYEATSFFKQLRLFLMSQSQKADQFSNILQLMIKALLPLQPQTTIASQRKQTSQIPQQSSKVDPKTQPKTKQQKQKSKKDSLQQPCESISLSWKVVKNVLGKKQQDELYSLYMQLRHGKRELHLQWLKKIHDLIKYWGYKWFRFRSDLVNELIDQFSKSKLKWLIIQIIRSILRGIYVSSQQLQSGQSDLTHLNSNKPSIKPNIEKESISLTGQLFESIYAAPLIDDIIFFSTGQQKHKVLLWVSKLQFKYSPSYFLNSFQMLTQGAQRQINLSELNSQIEFYSSNFPSCRAKISEIIQKIPPSWKLRPEDFPTLVGFLQQLEKNSAYHFISKYQGNWSLGANLHLVNQVINNLEKGVRGVNYREKKREMIKLYTDCLLTMAIAVQKQDPLMSFYPKVKKFLIEIIQNNECRRQAFQQILSAINSHSQVKYGSKSFLSSDLALMVFAEDTLFHKLFQQALYDEQSLGCWLAIIKRLVSSNVLENLNKYSIILYSLTYHKNQQIRELSKYLIQKLGKTGKMKILLGRLFSRSEEQRTKLTTDLFRSNSKNVYQELKAAPTEQVLRPVAKKSLKIGAQTIQNYAKIIFGNNLEQAIKLSAAEQLLQSVQRMGLSQQLIALLTNLAENIVHMLQTYQGISSNLCSCLVQIHYALNRKLPIISRISLFKAVELLESQIQSRSIIILLNYIYVQCFRNPFKQSPELHFVALLYPHLQFQTFKVSEDYVNKQVQTIQTCYQNSSKFSLPDYRQTKEIQHACESFIFKIINQEKVILDQTFIQIVQKQIGDTFHSSKGYIALHYLHYLFSFIKNHQIVVPDKIIDYTAPLLINMLSKEMPAIHSENEAQLLVLIGVKRTKQLNALLANGSFGTWKLFLIEKLTNVDTSVMQIILKGLIGLHYGRQATLTLKTLLPHLKINEVNQFTQNLIVTSCIKYIRQEQDYMLRKIAFCCLYELYGTNNLPTDGNIQLLASISSLLTEQTLQSQLMIFAVSLLKNIVENDQRVLDQSSILKLLLSRLLGLVTYRNTYTLLQAAILQLFRAVVKQNKIQLFGGADLTDISLPFLGLIQKQAHLSTLDVKLLISTLDLLYYNCENQSDLPKYLLTSTSVLYQLFTAFTKNIQDEGKSEFFQSLSRLWLKLALVEQDMFVYKLSQIVSKTNLSLILVLCKHLQFANSEYLKMLCWTIVIWSKNRQTIQDQMGLQIARTILSSNQPQLIKLILPFSLKAKQTFLTSQLLTQTVKSANNIIQARIVKDMKDKKKKNKLYVLEPKQLAILQKLFGFLSALFYWNGEGKIEVGQTITKGICFLEKFYLTGAWDQSIMKYFLRVVTNMTLATPLSDSVAACLSQSANFIQQIINSIIKCQSIDGMSKIALKLASSLANIESVRAQLLRSKMIGEISSRLLRDQQRGQLNLQYAMETVQLFLTFSIYKDSNQKILVDKRLLQLFVRLIQIGKLSFLQQKIVKLMANLACFKHNKAIFMNCKDLHKTILGLLEDPEIIFKSLLLSLLYNLLYKNSAALKLYRKPDVIQLIRHFEAEETGRILLQVLIQSEQN